MEKEQVQQALEQIKKLGYFDAVQEVVMAFDCWREKRLYHVEITDSHEQDSKTRYAVWIKNMNGRLNLGAMCPGAPDIATAIASANWGNMKLFNDREKD